MSGDSHMRVLNVFMMAAFTTVFANKSRPSLLVAKLLRILGPWLGWGGPTFSTMKVWEPHKEWKGFKME